MFGKLRTWSFASAHHPFIHSSLKRFFLFFLRRADNTRLAILLNSGIGKWKKLGVTFQSCSFTFPATSKHSFSTLSTHRGEQKPSIIFFWGGWKTNTLNTKKTNKQKRQSPKNIPTTSSISSWWLNQPLWKICSSKWLHLPQFSGWKSKKIELPPPS